MRTIIFILSFFIVSCEKELQVNDGPVQLDITTTSAGSNIMFLGFGHANLRTDSLYLFTVNQVKKLRFIDSAKKITYARRIQTKER